MTGKEIFKKANLSKMTNSRVIKYGKINENVAYEIVETNQYANNSKDKHLCILSFVEKKDEKYKYNTKNCVYDNFENILSYIARCKQEKKIIKN